jgi:hypothetical protein
MMPSPIAAMVETLLRTGATIEVVVQAVPDAERTAVEPGDSWWRLGDVVADIVDELDCSR